MPEWLGTPLLALAGIALTVTASYFTAKLTSTTQKKTAEVESRGPEWSAFVDEVRKQNTDTKTELNGKIDGLQAQVTGLKSEVRSMRGKLNQAMWHISAWRRRHPQDPLVGSLPIELHEDLPYEHGTY